MQEDFEVIVNGPVNHLGFYVRDLDKSLEFYNGLLGLPITRIIGTRENPTAVFLPGIELFQLKEGQEYSIGTFFAHLGIAIDNIEDLYQRLKERGVKMESALREFAWESVNQKLLRMALFDPDGILVELVKWVPL